jgi:predicted nucleic acid-binding protein
MKSQDIRIVIDTNVLFEGLTKQGGACGLIVDAWCAGLLTVCVSNALAYEYEEVLSRKLSEHHWKKVKLALGSLLDYQTEFIKIYISWRPISPDPGDDHVIDCAMNARVPVIPPMCEILNKLDTH